MAVSNESIRAYKEEALRLNKDQRRVYDFLLHNRYNSYTVRQIAKMLGCGHRSEIQPRVSDLVKLGHVIKHKSGRCDETGKTVGFFKFKTEGDQMEMF